VDIGFFGRLSSGTGFEVAKIYTWITERFFEAQDFDESDGFPKLILFEPSIVDPEICGGSYSMLPRKISYMKKNNCVAIFDEIEYVKWNNSDLRGRLDIFRDMIVSGIYDVKDSKISKENKKKIIRIIDRIFHNMKNSDTFNVYLNPDENLKLQKESVEVSRELLRAVERVSIEHLPEE